MTKQRIEKFKRAFRESRYRLIHKYGNEVRFLLTDMIFVAIDDVYRISTNGACIYFNPSWLTKLEERSLDFILLHQLMHIKMNHIERPMYYKGDRFHLACDIIANSHLWLSGWKYEKLPAIGKIYTETFYPRCPGVDLTPEEAIKYIPFDPASMPSVQRRRYIVDSEKYWDLKDDRGECGTIVLSPEDKDPDDLMYNDFSGGDSILVYHKIEWKKAEKSDKKQDNDDVMSLEAIINMLSNDCERVETDFTERLHQRPNTSVQNWKELLSMCLQEDVRDYSFSPPDRRYPESNFFLPDYNVTTFKPGKVLLMADTSASVDEKAFATVCTEICEILTQFNGGLECLLTTFDTRVYGTRKISSYSDVEGAPLYGGGGTDFNCIFRFVREQMQTDPPSVIVIFTDGKDEFPPEEAACGIPVVWLFTRNNVKAPWGKYACVP